MGNWREVGAKMIACILAVSLLSPIGIALLTNETAHAEVANHLEAQNGYWPMERGNPQRNGTSIFDLSELKPQVIWDIDLIKVAGWNKSNNMVSTVFFVLGMDGTIYLADSDHISAIYPNGTLKWTIQVNETPYMSPAIGGNDDLYVGTIVYGGASDPAHSVIYAIRPNGSIEWRLELPEILPMSLVVDESNTIYASTFGIEYVDQYNFTTVSNDLLAIHPNGSLMWRYSVSNAYLPSYRSSPPAIAPDGTIRFLTDESLTAINKNGSWRWTFDLSPTTGYARNDPLVTENGSTIFIHNHTLLSVNPEGRLQWSHDVHQWLGISDPQSLIYASHVIYLASNVGKLAAIRDNGSLEWVALPDSSFSYDSTMSHNGLIIILNNNNRLAAIGSNGTLVWETDVLDIGNSFSGPTEIVVGGDDRIYLRHADQHGMPLRLLAIGYEEPPGTTGGTFDAAWVSFGVVLVIIVTVSSFLIMSRRKRNV